MSDFSVDEAILILSTPAVDVENRINALRGLYHYIQQDESHIDTYNRKRINQLVLDNVMKIMLETSTSSNPFRKQLITVELFTLLSHLLRSDSVFGAEITEKVERAVQAADQNNEENNSLQASSISKHSSKKKAWAPAVNGSSLWRVRRRGIKAPGAATAEDRSVSVSKSLFSSSSLSDLSLVQQTLLSKLPKRIELDEKLKPRPAVLFNDKVVKERFAPGVDPQNFLEQDRKLGYQKPRMWFPSAMMSLTKDAMNAPLNQRQFATASEQIVEEYVKMRALASYIGDAVLPYSGTLPKFGEMARAVYQSRHSKDHKDTAIAMVDVSRHKHAVQEVMDMWTPVLAAHKNSLDGRKRRKFTLIHPPDHHDSQHAQQHSGGEGRRLHEMSMKFDDDDDDKVGRKDQSYAGKLQKLSREEIIEDLAHKKQTLDTSISKLTQQIRNYMDQSYQRFSTHYLLVMEGSTAHSRHALLKLAKLFLRMKRKNWLILAFGLLRVPVMEAKLQAKIPIFKRNAACNLLLEWMKRARRKNLVFWLSKWNYSVSTTIFMERMACATKIQTMVRMVRDRYKMMLMHRTKPYLGLLSDIYLAPYRNDIPFKIPLSIRTERQFYWQRAIIIQTVYRSWIESREYFLKKRRIILLQSIYRMWPKYCYYRRLKRTTIFVQSLARRTIKRNWFLRLKAATIVVQKYVRRFQKLCLKWKLMDVQWRELEERMYAAIVIQCRVRIMRSYRRRKGKIFYKKMVQWAALVIQRNWYRIKKAYHTFFLMCALRERESQDIYMEKLATTMGRNQCARRIERYYKTRFWQRFILNVVKVQCWYRGRRGYIYVDKLRREKWASRKLHHWAHARLRLRHQSARKIQHAWLRWKSLRRLQHLWYKQRVRDAQNRYELAERRYYAVMRIQARVKGIFDRKRIKQQKAIRKIIKNYRFFFGLKRLRRMKKDYLHKGIIKYVTKLFDKCLHTQVHKLVKKHIHMLIKPQAVCRGFIIRNIMYKSRLYATKLAHAAIVIQRFWRKSGMLIQAVEELLARRRRDNNPFKYSLLLHDVLLTARHETRVLYNIKDPRVGMRVYDFLLRLGYPEFIDIFPKRDYKFATELSTLTMDKLSELYLLAQNKRKPVSNNNNNNNDNEAKVNIKSKQIPTRDFQVILDLVKIPVFTKQKKELKLLQSALLSFPEYSTPQEAMTVIKNLFLKKFGRHLTTRANNLAHEIVETVYYQYNNFQCFTYENPDSVHSESSPGLGLGYGVLTKSQIARAIQIAPESGSVMNTLQENRLTALSMFNSDEHRKLEVDRLKNAGMILQMAVDRAMEILPLHGVIISKLEKMAMKITTFCRKSDYLIRKTMESERLAKLRTSNGNNKNSSVVTAKTPKVADPVNSIVNNNDVKVDKKKIPNENLNKLISTLTSAELIYHGPINVMYLQLEHYSTVAKLYSDILESLLMASLSVQSLKNTWNNHAIHRAMIHEKQRLFLDQQTKNYLHTQQTDFVHITWLKFRRQELAQQKLDILLTNIRYRKSQIMMILSYLPKYHVSTYYDEEYGYAYHIDHSLPLPQQVATWEMPTYTYLQYLAVEKIQCLARKHIARSILRRQHKEYLQLLELQKMEETLQQERKLALKAVSLSLTITSQVEYVKVYKPPSHHHKHPHNHNNKINEEDVEKLIPWKYRFCDMEKSTFKPGIWTLLFTPETPMKGKNSLPLRNGSYEIVVIVRVHYDDHIHTTTSGRPDKDHPVGVPGHSGGPADFLVCDVKTIKGQILHNISIRKLRNMNYFVGLPIEARYKYRKLFYRATVSHVDDYSHADNTYYDVTYEDQEKEENLGRDAIRPSLAALKQWLAERTQELQQALIIYNRRLWYEKMKEKKVETFRSNLKLDLAAEEAANKLKLPVESNKSVATTNYNANANTTDVVVVRKQGSDDDEDRDQDQDQEEEDVISDHTQEYDDNNDNDNDGAIDNEDITHNDDTHTHNDGNDNDQTIEDDNSTNNDSYNDNNSSIANNSSTVATATAAAVAASSLTKRVFLKVKLTVTKAALRYKWHVFTPPHSTDPRFYNPETGEETDASNPPFYTATEILHVTRIQRKWSLHRAFKFIRFKVAQINMQTYIAEVIANGAKMGFVGFKLEGLTSIQLLIRAGYYEIAEIIHEHYKFLYKEQKNRYSKHRHNKDLQPHFMLPSIEEIASCHADNFAAFLGIIQPLHSRDLREFQTWWKRTQPHERESKLTTFNSYSSPYDSRMMQNCIQDSLEICFKKFSKFIKTGATKTKRACETICDESNFPHTHQQLEVYLKKYGEKPELARESVAELIDKQTTSTFVEERKIFDLFRHASLRLCATLSVYKLKKWRLLLHAKITAADAIIASTMTFNKATRIKCSGPEAKAAWLLRQDVLDLMFKLCKATLMVQRNIRSYLLTKRLKALLEARKHAVMILQRDGRRYLAYKLAAFYRQQRSSPWEQLWDTTRNVMHYFNYVTNHSQYAAPPMNQPYRPLIRHPLSAALMQAWPDLDEQRAAYYPSSLPQNNNNTAVINETVLQCQVCHVRKAVKLCLDCRFTDSEEQELTEDGYNYRLHITHRAVPYCLICHAKEHPEDQVDKANHRHVLANHHIEPSDNVQETTAAEGEQQKEAQQDDQQFDGTLHCCMCNQPATRKCLGSYRDEILDELLNQLKRAKLSEWPAVLQRNDVAGERKLVLLLEEMTIEQDPQFTSISPVQLQSIRGFFARLRAECDECYCDTCYLSVHSHGRRARHHWLGFQANAVVCGVCQSTPAEMHCNDCPGEYCQSCWKVFHTKGHKRKHKHMIVNETLHDGESYCEVCKRRAGHACEHERCSTIVCPECFEFKHKNTTCIQARLDNLQRLKDEQVMKEKSKGFPCTVCGEAGDKLCVECNDYYCSRTWMGNPGCFFQMHSKGNRATHTTTLIPQLVTAQRRQSSRGRESTRHSSPTARSTMRSSTRGTIRSVRSPGGSRDSVRSPGSSRDGVRSPPDSGGGAVLVDNGGIFRLGSPPNMLEMAVLPAGDNDSSTITSTRETTEHRRSSTVRKSVRGSVRNSVRPPSSSIAGGRESVQSSVNSGAL